MKNYLIAFFVWFMLTVGMIFFGWGAYEIYMLLPTLNNRWLTIAGVVGLFMSTALTVFLFILQIFIYKEGLELR